MNKYSKDTDMTIISLKKDLKNRLRKECKRKGVTYSFLIEDLMDNKMKFKSDRVIGNRVGENKHGSDIDD